MRIYTRFGDNGDTSIIGPNRVPKDDPRIHAVGDVDELNAILGLARTEAPAPEVEITIADIQNQLFVLGADLAAPYPDEGPPSVPRIGTEHVTTLEMVIDAYQSRLPELSTFIIPGGSRCSSCLHLARAVCRRAERSVVALSRTATLNPNLLPFLNRLSDLLFVMARIANSIASIPDTPWKPTSEA
ncbi:MAG: cob(I)yrinic acid a,c-diamide adenosyltransferase [Armatimonadota bacterium]